MTSTERFRLVMDILSKNDLCNCSRNHTIFDRLNDDEFTDKNKVAKIVEEIYNIESRIENNPNKYSEYIMQILRQNIGLEMYDTSNDEEINTLVYKTPTRIEAMSGTHDDVIFAYLIGQYIMQFGTNKAAFRLFYSADGNDDDEPVNNVDKNVFAKSF